MYRYLQMGKKKDTKFSPGHKEYYVEGPSNTPPQSSQSSSHPIYIISDEESQDNKEEVPPALNGIESRAFTTAPQHLGNHDQMPLYDLATWLNCGIYNVAESNESTTAPQYPGDQENMPSCDLGACIDYGAYNPGNYEITQQSDESTFFIGDSDEEFANFFCSFEDPMIEIFMPVPELEALSERTMNFEEFIVDSPLSSDEIIFACYEADDEIQEEDASNSGDFSTCSNEPTFTGTLT
ncbi:hypothetical protein Scep_010419 [Stephania cephalantha]|uniref:Uncharacterized protein n=1 Tax=Stephania cephalantha TaxID=152367 RepID=A0AAP0PDA9_9MAGN